MHPSYIAGAVILLAGVGGWFLWQEPGVRDALQGGAWSADTVASARTQETASFDAIFTIESEAEAAEQTESQPTRFSDTEAGFDDESGEGTVPPISLPSLPVPIQAIIPSMPVSSGMSFGGWGQYWRDFSPLEQMIYGNWQRPPGPLRVGLQSGHWRLDEVPEELSGLRASSGARGGGYTEQETVLIIAQRTKALLEAEGIVVDLLPATIPPGYVADAFVSIHADGATSANVNGYKISGPRRDFSGKADALVSALYDSYGAATGLRRDPNITRRMSSYYAFNWRRYEHALHPMTPGAIVETGFMTSATDRAVIVTAPDRAARGIAEGILAFLGRN